MKLGFLFLCLLVVTPLMAQNLMEERIWKVSPRKKSIFLDSGVFHHNSTVKDATIVTVRNSTVAGRGYERVVVDFNTTSIPKIYGHITENKKISVDFFETSMASNKVQIKDSKFVKSIDFISVDGKTITMEIAMKGKASFDIFYLDSPGRLVIDIR